MPSGPGDFPDFKCASAFLSSWGESLLSRRGSNVGSQIFISALVAVLPSITPFSFKSPLKYVTHFSGGILSAESVCFIPQLFILLIIFQNAFGAFCPIAINSLVRLCLHARSDFRQIFL